MRGNLDETRLTSSSFSEPLWFASLWWWPLFSLFSGALCISFSPYGSLNIRLSRYAFYCSLSRSSCRFLLVLTSFLTLLRVFLDSLDAFYLLLSSVALSISFQPIFHSKTCLHRRIIKISRGWQSFSSASIVALRVDKKKSKNTENYCSTTITSIWFPAQNACCKLFAHVASHLRAHVNPFSDT